MALFIHKGEGSGQRIDERMRDAEIIENEWATVLKLEKNGPRLKIAWAINVY